jgi:hypothetical protein
VREALCIWRYWIMRYPIHYLGRMYDPGMGINTSLHHHISSKDINVTMQMKVEFVIQYPSHPH